MTSSESFSRRSVRARRWNSAAWPCAAALVVDFQKSIPELPCIAAAASCGLFWARLPIYFLCNTDPMAARDGKPADFLLTYA